MKYKIGIIGSTGYTGVVLTGLLLKHPLVKLTYLSSEQYSGKYFYEVYPAFYGLTKEKCKPVNVKEIAKNCDLVFLATPNNFSLKFLPKLLKEKKDIKVIDLSADLRLLKTIKLNKKQSLKITYGLPEIHKCEIIKSQIVSNPGCYPTSVILALAPLVKNNLIDLNSIIIDSKSGVSGAGRGAKTELLFCEVNEAFSPYNLAGKHRHIPEIENELSLLAKLGKLRNKKIKVVFSPHLIPINRGILSTIYADLKKPKITQKEIYKLYKDFYRDEYFVKVLPENTYANTKSVRYTNFCHLTPLKDKRVNKVIIASAIDNMVKGASGQAVQNMNLMLNLPEISGLDTGGQIP